MPDFSQRFTKRFLLSPSVFDALGWKRIGLGHKGWSDQMDDAEKEAFYISDETKPRMTNIIEFSRESLANPLTSWMDAFKDARKVKDFWSTGLALEEIAKYHAAKNNPESAVSFYILADRYFRSALLNMTEEGMRTVILSQEITNQRRSLLSSALLLFDGISTDDSFINRTLIYILVNGAEVRFHYDKLADICDEICKRKKDFSIRERRLAKNLARACREVGRSYSATVSATRYMKKFEKQVNDLDSIASPS